MTESMNSIVGRLSNASAYHMTSTEQNELFATAARGMRQLINERVALLQKVAYLEGMMEGINRSKTVSPKVHTNNEVKP